jgi:RoxA-like, cytochrome c-like
MTGLSLRQVPAVDNQPSGWKTVPVFLASWWRRVIARPVVIGIAVLAAVAAGIMALYRMPPPSNAGTGEAQEYRSLSGTAGAGLVTAPENDTSTQIVSWVDRQAISDWPAEIRKRDRAIEGYLGDADPDRAARYGFRSGQTPQLAWNWFRNNPVGFNGVPFVLFKTMLDLDPNDANPPLRTIARIWKHEVQDGSGTPARWTLDHIGVEPGPTDYADGVARPDRERSPLPYGFAFENARTFDPLSSAETAIYDGRLLARRVFQHTSLLIAKLATTDHEENWERDRPGFGSPGTMDRVFLSCAACHVGRVMVAGRMKFLPGMPNTQFEAQYYSKLLMLTAAALTTSGFDPSSSAPVNPAHIKPDTAAVRALYAAMLDKARQHPDTMYGSSPAQIARAKIQTLAVADMFPSVIQDLIALGVKTHFIYQVVAKNHAYQQPFPDVFGDRPGQMDAFGVASGLVAIHMRRPDNSFIAFVSRDNRQSPFFTGFSKVNGLPADIPGMTDQVTDLKAAGERVFRNISAWAPSVPAPVDIKSVNWASERYHANWDGNQGASSRALASGVSATGDPRMANVRIHEPLNPFIDSLPPPPYPFGSVDLVRAREGKAIYREKCATCHSPRNQTIYPASALGVDPNRTLVNTSVSRLGLAALVMEACTIYGLDHQGQPGADWCMPKGDWQARLDEYFRDTPARVAAGINGYKADVLHGIWAQAPYLHNGSVPTLGHLVCPSTRPQRFLRGNAYYDEALVGFEWADRPKSRYSPHDTMLVKEYDTKVAGKSNAGHPFGAEMCPDTSGLDPRSSRKEIETRILGSQVGALLAYLKTL